MVATISVLEDDSLSMGRGAVYAAKACTNSTPASGEDRNCGAITGLQGYRHPIAVARGLDRPNMSSSADLVHAKFAEQQGAESAEEGWFDTQKAHDRYLRARTGHHP